eukprot:566258-Prymnesium_polylepis.1
MDGLPRRQCARSDTRRAVPVGRTQKSRAARHPTRRARDSTASRPEQLRTCRGFVRAPGVLA